MAIPGNRHCANCIGTVTFPIETELSKDCIFLFSTKLFQILIKSNIVQTLARHDAFAKRLLEFWPQS